MGILISSLILILAAAALGILRVYRPRFRFTWLIAVAATTVAWLSVFLWIPFLPIAVDVPLWHSAASSNSFATFSVTSLTWPYALCLVSGTLALLFTAPARWSLPRPFTWALCLVVAGLGVLAMASDDALTLVLLWASLDLVEAGVLLGRLENRSLGTQAPIAFTARMAGTALLLLGHVLAGTATPGSGFGGIGESGVALLAGGAALLRLIAVTAPWPRSESTSDLDELGIILQLATGAASVAFLSQLQLRAHESALVLLILCAAAALYAGWMWLRAPNIHAAHSFWVLGAGSLAVAAALRGSPMGGTGWGCGMLLAGSAVFFTEAQGRWSNSRALLVIWICSALPFTLTANAWIGSGGAMDLVLPLLLVAQALLLAGFLRRPIGPEIETASQAGTPTLGAIPRFGIAMPLVVGVLLGVWGWPGTLQFGAPLASLVVLPVIVALVWAKRRSAWLNPGSTAWHPATWITAASLVGRELTAVESSLQRAAAAITDTMEGEAGIMWSLSFSCCF